MAEQRDLPRLSYNEFQNSVGWKVGSFPSEGQWELTFRCNYRCQHCYIPPEQLAGKIKDQELTLPEVRAILDQLREAGVLYLTFTGGDPLLRRDFLEIYLHAKKLAFFIVVLTNGSLVTDNIADAFQRYPPLQIEISLYGITKETYETVTRIPGSFERCMQGIRRLVEREIPLTLKTPGINLLYPEILKMKAFARSIGAHFRFDPDITPRLDGSKAPLALRLTPDQIVALEYQDSKWRSDWRERFRDDCGTMSPPSSSVFPCSFGKKTFYIGPTGHMTHCHYVRQPSSDLRVHPVREAFEEIENQLQQLKQPTNPHTCDSPNQCMRCPGRALLEEGDPTKSVAYFCEVTEKRVEEKEKLYQKDPTDVLC